MAWRLTGAHQPQTKLAAFLGDSVENVVLVVPKKQMRFVNDHDVAQQAFLFTANRTFFQCCGKEFLQSEFDKEALFIFSQRRAVVMPNRIIRIEWRLFDEIQVVSDWEPFVDRLMRTEKCEVYITGSSAQMLSREIATQMRGRAISWEMFPFSFREFLDFKGIDSNDPLSTKKRLLVQKAFEDYWETGGFPEVAGLDRLLRIKTHQEYFNTLMFRDLIERHDISHPKAITDLAHWLVDNTASLYSVNNLTGYLKSLGHKSPKSSVSDYLEWFEDAYVLFTVRIFDASLARANTNPKKIYCIDHALVTSVSSGILTNSGHLLENLVFTALRRITPDIFYFKSKGGREVDFIGQRQNRSRMLVQVCESMADPRTRKRKIIALSEAMVELKLTEGIIVTRGEEEQIQVESGRVDVIPVWRFLLNLPSTSWE